ncbi:hypothetical protein BU26DRAFT_521223 [Trematosphaeria pertusa]|uniref:Uncharacterized protein n=1 Tax=Trematosphaeria pertusa TaxID=390896 RepID=A0A6A6I8C7_9PLEO|nr:uncharacterized protein BU26DRAFT_521223 [Trematosphaeria pertusa]KAF2246805.1 hypothetical protein BU26DRAFT_521223 [Trematosphaeria pertusa]
MTEPTPTSLRVAYIRTVPPPKHPAEIFSFIASHVSQPLPQAGGGASPRHRFLVGSANAFDAQILDFFIAKIEPRTPAQLPSESEQWAFKRMARSDVEFRIPRSRSSTPSGQKLQKRCADAGIATRISGADDEECDEIMLQESDYLIDFLTPTLRFDYEHWFWHHVSPGVPQDSMLTNDNYNTKQLDTSHLCLPTRFAGYGWKHSSGAYHGNGGNWWCTMCGGKCKRGRCRGQGNKKRVAERKEAEEQQQKWRAEWLRLPEPRSEKWREWTADDMCWKFHMLGLPRYKDEKRWHSVDTFSGE